MGTPEGPVWVRTSIVHRYGTAERPVEPRRVTTCPELRWKAHIFFRAKTDMPPNMTHFLVLL